MTTQPVAQSIDTLSAQQIERLSDKDIGKLTEPKLSLLVDRYLQLKDIKSNLDNIEFITTFLNRIIHFHNDSKIITLKILNYLASCSQEDSLKNWAIPEINKYFYSSKIKYFPPELMKYINVKRLTEIDIKFLNPQDLAHFTQDQLAGFSLEQLETFDPDQFKALGTDKVNFLIRHNRGLIDINQRSQLSSFIDFLNKIPNLDTKLPIIQKISEFITENFMSNLNEIDSKYIPYINIKELEFDDIKNFSPKQIKKLSHKQISDFSKDMIQELSKEQMQAFSPEQIRYFSPQQIRYFLPKRNFELSAKISFSFPPEQIQYLSLEQIVNFINDVTVEYFNLEDIESLTDIQIKYLIINKKIELILNKLMNLYSEFTTENDPIKTKVKLKINAIIDEINTLKKHSSIETPYLKQLLATFDKEIASQTKKENPDDDDEIYILKSLPTDPIDLEQIKLLTNTELEMYHTQLIKKINEFIEEKYKNSTAEEILEESRNYMASKIRLIFVNMFSKKIEEQAPAAKAAKAGPSKKVIFNIENNSFYDPSDAYIAVKREEAIDWENNRDIRARLQSLRKQEVIQEKRLRHSSQQSQDKATTYENDDK